MFDRQPQCWADGPGAGTFQHTVSPTKTKGFTIGFDLQPGSLAAQPAGEHK